MFCGSELSRFFGHRKLHGINRQSLAQSNVAPLLAVTASTIPANAGSARHTPRALADGMATR